MRHRAIHAQSSFGSRTDVGCVRERNEDSLVVSPPLFAVADGMGGHAAGDVASETAVETLQKFAPTSANVEDLGQAVINANMAVIEESRKAGLEGMGTTMTAAVIEKSRIAIAHVGDSRAYLLHHGRLQQITRDHSLMADMIEAGRITPEEARHHPNRSIITRALGSDPAMQPDLYELTASPGDRLLLCSDGLYSMVEDEQIQSILARTRDPQRCASALVNAAIAAGGLDNTTVIVVDITGDSIEQRKKKVFRSRMGMVALILALLAIVGTAAFALSSYINNSAYLITEDGKVAVYQGIDDEFLGMPLSHLDRVTDVKVDDLEAGVQVRLEEGIALDSLDEANNIINQYEEYVAQQQEAESAKNSKKKGGRE
ncbi:MAG: Stp1/IreP family PP2C-type Ser/Thr phosphatase [Eggerthellales bacterium]|nr:Stp1/IreP family PP2C-type Ser/Thr phosphatase [Eggerthellales bacterium]